MIKSQVLGATTVSALPVVSFDNLLFEQPFSIRGSENLKPVGKIGGVMRFHIPEKMGGSFFCTLAVVSVPSTIGLG